jgi:hypothetical protein
MITHIGQSMVPVRCVRVALRAVICENMICEHDCLLRKMVSVLRMLIQPCRPRQGSSNLCCSPVVECLISPWLCIASEAAVR